MSTTYAPATHQTYVKMCRQLTGYLVILHRQHCHNNSNMNISYIISFRQKNQSVGSHWSYFINYMIYLPYIYGPRWQAMVLILSIHCMGSPDRYYPYTVTILPEAFQSVQLLLCAEERGVPRKGVCRGGIMCRWVCRAAAGDDRANALAQFTTLHCICSVVGWVRYNVVTLCEC